MRATVRICSIPQHLGTFGGQRLAAAGGGAAGLGGGGAAMRGGGGAGAAIRAGGGGALTRGGRGGGAVKRGGGGDGEAIRGCGGGVGRDTLGGGGGGGAVMRGGGDGEAIRGCGGGVGRDTLGGGGGGVRAACGTLGGGFGIEVTAGLGGTPAAPEGGVVATVDPTLGGGPAGGPGGFGAPAAAGAFAPGNRATPAPAGAFGATVDEGAVPWCGPGGVTSLALGLAVPGAPVAALGGGGGAPFVPGTGSAFAFGKDWPPWGENAGALAGCTAGAAVPVGPGLRAGLIAALGGTGALPCWIRLARCATDGGSAGLAAPGAAMGIPPLAPGGTTAPSPRCPGAKPGCGGRLITLLMTVVLWMLAKMMLFGGGLT